MEAEASERLLIGGLVGMLKERQKSKPYDETEFCDAWLNGGAQ
jgi:hypothetical protein